MTSTRDALIAAVAASPDDDLPRLVFADYLEENGDSVWANLIRRQCEFPQDKLVSGWYSSGPRPTGLQLWYTRGFVLYVAATWEYWLLSGDHLLSLHPTVKSVYLRTPVEIEARTSSGWGRLHSNNFFAWDRLRIGGRVFKRDEIEKKAKSWNLVFPPTAALCLRWPRVAPGSWKYVLS